MSSSDYYDYLSRLMRTPSAVTTDVPRYGNAPMFFRNSRMTTGNTREADRDRKEDDQNKSHTTKKQQHTPHFQEKVEVFEYDQQSGAGDGNYVMNGNSVNSQVCDDDVNAIANSFIQQKRKGFELCKWKTFKAH